MRMTLRTYSLVTLIVAAVTSASIWMVSPMWLGRAEPWDADGFFYVGALAAAGLISGALRPKPLWAQYVGSVGGQLAYEALFLPVGPLILLGAVFLLGYSVIFLAGAAVAALLRSWLIPSSRSPCRGSAKRNLSTL